MKIKKIIYLSFIIAMVSSCNSTIKSDVEFLPYEKELLNYGEEHVLFDEMYQTNYLNKITGEQDFIVTISAKSDIEDNTVLNVASSNKPFKETKKESLNLTAIYDYDTKSFYYQEEEYRCSEIEKINKTEVTNIVEYILQDSGKYYDISHDILEFSSDLALSERMRIIKNRSCKSSGFGKNIYDLCNAIFIAEEGWDISGVKIYKDNDVFTLTYDYVSENAYVKDESFTIRQYLFSNDSFIVNSQIQTNTNNNNSKIKIENSSVIFKIEFSNQDLNEKVDKYLK